MTTIGLARKAANKSVEEAARAARVSSSTIRRYEAGDPVPESTARRLALLYACPMQLACNKKHPKTKGAAKTRI